MVYDEILKQAQKAAGAEAPKPKRSKQAHEAQELLNKPETERSRWSPETRLSTMPPEDLDVHDHHQTIDEQRYPPSGFRIAIPKIDLPSKIWSWVMSKLPTFDFNDLLPVALEAKRGAITLGNAFTPVIFTITFGSGRGTYGLKPVSPIQKFVASLLLWVRPDHDLTNINKYTSSTFSMSPSSLKTTKTITSLWPKKGNDFTRDLR